MNWRVTFRDKNGKHATVDYDADSRQDLFKILAGKRIAVVRIEQSDRKSLKGEILSLRVNKVIVWLAICVITAVVAFYLANSIASNSNRKPKSEKNEEKTSKFVAPKPSEPPKFLPSSAPSKVAEKVEKPKFVKKAGQLQLPDGQVLTFPPPKEGEKRKVYAYGHMYECDHLGNFTDVTPRKLFHSAFEGNFLALATERAAFIPAFLTGLDQDEVKKILLKDYQPIGDETDDEMEQLKAYDDMRCAALQYMDEGGTFDDFVEYFAKQAKEERQVNATCLREVMTLYKEGKVAEAKEMAIASDMLKEKKGLKSFKLPNHVIDAFEAIQ